jgi:hypothetical protein
MSLAQSRLMGLTVDTGDAGNGLNYGFDVKNAASGSATSYAMPAISWANGGLRWASVHGERNPAGGFGGSFVVNTMNSAGSAVKRLGIDLNGDLSLYEDTGTTAKFFWDASEERLGIGTTSPSVDLDVEGTAQVNLLEVTHDADRAVNFVKTGANTFSIEHDVNQFYFWNQTTSESPLLFQNDGDVIINGGNVGIGTSSPSNTLDLRKDTPAFSQTSSSGAYYTTLGTNVDYTKSFVLNNKGSEIITYGDDTGYGLNLNGGASNLIRFTTNATERMRIDSSGNLLVGKTATAFGTAGIEARAGGTLWATASGTNAASFNRLTNDGDIAIFAKDGTAVGSIGVEGGDLTIGTDTQTGLHFWNNSAIRPWNITANTRADAVCNLGESNTRFKDLYLSGGVYLGGTGAANLLDDYEEGTWTPTLVRPSAGGFTYTPAVGDVGYYTKVGNICYVSATLGGTFSGGSGYYQINGLPFNNANNGTALSVGNLANLSAGAAIGITVANVNASSTIVYGTPVSGNVHSFSAVYAV